MRTSIPGRLDYLPENAAVLASSYGLVACADRGERRRDVAAVLSPEHVDDPSFFRELADEFLAAAEALRQRAAQLEATA